MSMPKQFDSSKKVFGSDEPTELQAGSAAHPGFTEL